MKKWCDVGEEWTGVVLFSPILSSLLVSPAKRLSLDDLTMTGLLRTGALQICVECGENGVRRSRNALS